MLLSKIKLNFGARIFVSFFLLLLSLQALTAWLVYRASYSEVENRVEQQLQVANRLFQQEFTNRRQYLNSIVKVVARDWAFRQAIGASDLTTVKDVIDSYARRIGADLAVYADNNQALFSSTLDMSLDDQKRMEQILFNGSQQHIFSIDSKYFILVSSQVRSPQPRGWLAMGFRVDDKLANYFKSITQLETSFVQMHTGELTIVATTLNKDEAKLMLKSFELLDASQRFVPHYLAKQQDVIQAGVMLDYSLKGEMIALQQVSIESYISRLMSWWRDLMLLFAVALFLFGLVALLIARSVTHPLRSLLYTAREIASGVYENKINTKAIDLRRKDEIGELSREFDAMQRAVALRENEIRYRAEFSALTGLQNRDYFLQKLGEELKAKSETILGVYVVNLKGFREVNDTLGHHIGDRILRQVSERLQVKFTPKCLAHLGADQFAIVESQENLNALQEKSKSLQQLLEAAFELENIQLSMSIAIGLAVHPVHSSESASLLRFAEVAMYKSKTSSSDLVVYNSSLDRHSVRRLTLLGELPSAIENEQLILNYQPTLEFVDGEAVISKVECLVRWIHPSLGFIPPDEFIPLAEQTGSITKLTHWVLRTAAQQCASWLHSGRSISVAVNISAIDLFKGDLLKYIPSLLEDCNIPAGLLTLEVTESAVVEDIDQAITILKKLKKLGLRLSVDDYGTGYSSLAQLKHLPVDELKIDKSFVLELPNSQDDATIVRSTIELGHLMGLKVVAEGVENQACLNFLQEYRCDYAQGYFISKPINSEALGFWFDETEFAIRRT